MTFLETIFARLKQSAAQPVLREIREGGFAEVTGRELLALVQQARRFLTKAGLRKGDRCVLLGLNSIRWAALDLAAMAEGIIVVPLYARQAPGELVGMMKDSAPARICCSDPALSAEIEKIWPAAPPITLLEAIFTGEDVPASEAYRHKDSDALTIMYTSGTSGEPKGAVLNAGNVNHILSCTNARLDQLMGSRGELDRIFQYLPCNFTGSWILLLTALSRHSVLMFSTDLSKLAVELKLATPDYFLNVPALLERLRSRIEDAVQQRGGITATIFPRAQKAYVHRHTGQMHWADRACLALGRALLFPTIRRSLGPNLKALICGSAPLAVDTQLFFMMLGIPVLQVYGLTETTAICTMDDPRCVEPGRAGPAIPGIEMKLGENDEILVRGPNIFPGYWQKPDETAKVMEGGWFHTGDQGKVNSRGNWRVTGRIKNLIILNSGHNIAPEPLEESLERALAGAGHVVLVGNRRSYLVALVAGNSSNGLTAARIQATIDGMNAGLPHFKQIRAFHLVPESFTAENGLLTANGKLRREVIAERFAAEIEQLYRKKMA